MTDVAATVSVMTLQTKEYEVGVRELHDRLSEHLERVEGGAAVVVTRHGRPIARLAPLELGEPLADLIRRGLVSAPTRARSARRATVRAKGPVSGLVAEQRR